MFFSDAICWPHFSLVIKGKPTFSKKMVSLFPLASLILMRFRDYSIAILQIENNSKFLSLFLERGQEITRILALTTTYE
jgi:hypothetical protein